MKALFFWLKRLLAIFFSLLILAYLLLVLININDEAKSATVIEFEQFLAQRITVDNKNNAFVYAMALTADTGDDYYLAGVERIQKANTVTSVKDYSPVQDQVNTSNIEDMFTVLTKACSKPINLTKNCAEYL